MGLFTDHNALPPRLGTSAEREPIPVVKNIDLADEGISAVFRKAGEYGENFDQEIFKEIWQALARDQSRRLADSTKIAQDEFELSRALVRVELREIAKTLPKSIGKHYLNDSLPDRDLIEVLAYASSSQRTQFVSSLINDEPLNPGLKLFLDRKLGNILNFTSIEERAKILGEVLNGSSSEKVSYFGVGILRASHDFAQLQNLIKCVGVENILERGDAAMGELAAKATFLGEYRAMPVMPRLGRDAAASKIEFTLEAIDRSLEARIDAIRGHTEFALSTTSRQFIDLAVDNLEYLRSGRAAVTSRADRIELANLLITKIDFEFTWGIKLSAEQPGWLTKGSKWDEASIVNADRALRTLPEGLVLSTPRLNEFQRVETLGELVLGQRFPDGRIKIADFAIDNKYVEASHRGIDCLITTLVHEIGHGVQLGESDLDFAPDAAGGITLAGGDAEYDFSEYMRLSGWRLIDPSRWDWARGQGGFSVVLDGVERPIGVPIKINDKEITITFDQGLLYYHDTYAPFSLVTYARTNPWEDWAEAFKEYCLLPDRLIQFAPEKFMFLEQEFRKYGNNRELMDMVRRETELRWKVHRTTEKDAA